MRDIILLFRRIKCITRETQVSSVIEGRMLFSSDFLRLLISKWTSLMLRNWIQNEQRYDISLEQRTNDQ